MKTAFSGEKRVRKGTKWDKNEQKGTELEKFTLLYDQIELTGYIIHHLLGW